MNGFGPNGLFPPPNGLHRLHRSFLCVTRFWLHWIHRNGPSIRARQSLQWSPGLATKPNLHLAHGYGIISIIILDLLQKWHSSPSISTKLNLHLGQGCGPNFRNGGWYKFVGGRNGLLI